MDLLSACRAGFGGIQVDNLVKERAISYLRQWLSGEALSGVGLSLFLLDIYALWWLLSNRRLRACFREVTD